MNYDNSTVLRISGCSVPAINGLYTRSDPNSSEFRHESSSDYSLRVSRVWEVWDKRTDKKLFVRKVENSNPCGNAPSYIWVSVRQNTPNFEYNMRLKREMTAPTVPKRVLDISEANDKVNEPIGQQQQNFTPLVDAGGPTKMDSDSSGEKHSCGIPQNGSSVPGCTKPATSYAKESSHAIDNTKEASSEEPCVVLITWGGSTPVDVHVPPSFVKRMESKGLGQYAKEHPSTRLKVGAKDALAHWRKGFLSCDQAIVKHRGMKTATQKQFQQIKQQLHEVQSIVTQLESELKDAEERTANAREGAQNVAEVLGTGYVKRGKISTVEGDFPNGDMLQEMYRKYFLDANRFEELCIGAVDLLAKSKGSFDSAYKNSMEELFAVTVLEPMHLLAMETVEQQVMAKKRFLSENFYVDIDAAISVSCAEDSSTKLFWFQYMQPLLLKKMESIDEEAYFQMVRGMGTVPCTLLTGLNDVDLTLVRLMKQLCSLQACVQLSDPKCYLLPAPGQKMPWDPDAMVEILLSQSTKGKLQPGSSQVLVLLPGLYFDDADSAKPVAKALVCRCQRSDKKWFPFYK